LKKLEKKMNPQDRARLRSLTSTYNEEERLQAIESARRLKELTREYNEFVKERKKINPNAGDAGESETDQEEKASTSRTTPVKAAGHAGKGAVSPASTVVNQNPRSPPRVETTVRPPPASSYPEPPVRSPVFAPATSRRLANKNRNPRPHAERKEQSPPKPTRRKQVWPSERPSRGWNDRFHVQESKPTSVRRDHRVLDDSPDPTPSLAAGLAAKPRRRSGGPWKRPPTVDHVHKRKIWGKVKRGANPSRIRSSGYGPPQKKRSGGKKKRVQTLERQIALALTRGTLNKHMILQATKIARQKGGDPATIARLQRLVEDPTPDPTPPLEIEPQQCAEERSPSKAASAISGPPQLGIPAPQAFLGRPVEVSTVNPQIENKLDQLLDELRELRATPRESLVHPLQLATPEKKVPEEPSGPNAEERRSALEERLRIAIQLADDHLTGAVSAVCGEVAGQGDPVQTAPAPAGEAGNAKPTVVKEPAGDERAGEAGFEVEERESERPVGRWSGLRERIRAPDRGLVARCATEQRAALRRATKTRAAYHAEVMDSLSQRVVDRVIGKVAGEFEQLCDDVVDRLLECETQP